MSCPNSGRGGRPVPAYRCWTRSSPTAPLHAGSSLVRALLDRRDPDLDAVCREGYCRR